MSRPQVKQSGNYYRLTWQVIRDFVGNVLFFIGIVFIEIEKFIR